MTQSLHAIVLKLTANRAGSLHSTVGELGHAAFYAAINAVDPQLAQRVHDAEKRKPFSLSPLYGYWQSPKDKRIHIGAGQEGWLRLGLLDEELFSAFMQHILCSGVTGGVPGIQLGDIPFTITESLGTPGSHPWVGYTTMQQLVYLDDAPDRWVLEFESPAAIRWGQADKEGQIDKGARRVEIFPQPRLMIASLRSRWNRMVDDCFGEAGEPFKYDRDFEEWVERNVVVSKVFEWQTQPFPYRKQTYVGGLGKLEYRLLDTSNRAYAIHFHRLMHLAFFAGVGYKTTHGLGQVRLV